MQEKITIPPYTVMHFNLYIFSGFQISIQYIIISMITIVITMHIFEETSSFISDIHRSMNAMSCVFSKGRPNFTRRSIAFILRWMSVRILYLHLFSYFSSPEPLGSQGELIVYPYSGVRCRRCRRGQQCLNIFSSETALPIKAKFYVEPPWEGGMKVYINGPGHMTKMAAMPIYGKNL